MGRLPPTAVLGIALISFSCMTMFACAKHNKSDGVSKKDAEIAVAFAYIIGLMCAFAGIIVHIANLDVEAAASSWAIALLGANATSLYAYFMVEPAQWLDWSPLVVLTVVVGLVIGLLIYDGDPQIYTKRMATLEDQVKKGLADAEEARAKWQRLVDEQKLKVDGTEQKT